MIIQELHSVRITGTLILSQYELNAQLDLENAKAMDADLGGPDEEKSEDRIENAGIVAEDKGIYMPDRNRKR